MDMMNTTCPAELNFTPQSFLFSKDLQSSQKPFVLYGVTPGVLELESGVVQATIDGSRPLLISADSPLVISWATPITVILEQVGHLNASFSVHFQCSKAPLCSSRNIKNLRMVTGDTTRLTSAPADIAFNYLKTNFHRSFSLNDLGLIAGRSSHYLARSFKKKFGAPPFCLLRSIRCYHALLFLINKSKTGTEIANNLGFYDQSHFIRSFKTTFGLTPNSFLSQLSFASTITQESKLSPSTES